MSGKFPRRRDLSIWGGELLPAARLLHRATPSSAGEPASVAEPASGEVSIGWEAILALGLALCRRQRLCALEEGDEGEGGRSLLGGKDQSSVRERAKEARAASASQSCLAAGISTTIEFRSLRFSHTAGSMMDLRQWIACLALACSVALVHAQFPPDSPEGLTQVGRFDEALVLFEKVPPTIRVHCHTF